MSLFTFEKELIAEIKKLNGDAVKHKDIMQWVLGSEDEDILDQVPREKHVFVKSLSCWVAYLLPEHKQSHA